MDVLHKILDRIGTSYVSIGPAISDKTGTVIKGFSFIVMGDGGYLSRLFAAHFDLIMIYQNLHW